MIETDTSWPFGARYYSSNLGRFTPDWSATPAATPYANLENPQSLNLHSYVLNNPAAAPDPEGHCCFGWLVGLFTSDPGGGLSPAAQSLLSWEPQTLNGSPPVRLGAAQDFAMEAPEFQPESQTATHCNQATLCIAEALRRRGPRDASLGGARGVIRPAPFQPGEAAALGPAPTLSYSMSGNPLARVPAARRAAPRAQRGGRE